MKTSSIIILIAAATCLTVTLLVATGTVEIGVPGEWLWNRVKPVHWAAAGVAAAIGLALAAAAWYLSAVRRASASALLLLLVLGGLVFQIGMGAVSVIPFAGEGAFVTLAPYVGGYFSQAQRVDGVMQFLRGYADWMRPIPLDDRTLGHLGDHPPGIVLFHVAVIRFFEIFPSAAKPVNFLAGVAVPQGAELARSIAGAELPEAHLAGLWLSVFLLRLAMVLSVIPFYGLVRSFQPKEVAFRAAILFAFTPAFFLFSPSPDELFVLCSVLLGLLVVISWQRKSLWAGLIAGALFFFALNLTVALAVLLGVGVIAAGLSLAARLKNGESPRGVAIRIAAVACGGAAGFFALAGVAAARGYNAFEVWHLCLQKHSQFSALFQRTYWKWLLVNPVEFWAFLGVPAGILLVWRIIDGLRKGCFRDFCRDAPLAAFLVSIVLLNLSGRNLGEVARLWMFLMPYAILALSQSLRTLSIAAVSFLAACQALQAVAFKLTLDLFSLGQLLPR